MTIFGNILPYLSQSIVCEIKVQFSKYKTGQGTILKIWIWTPGHYIRDFPDHDKQSWTRLGRLIV